MFQPCQAALLFISSVNPCGLSSTPTLSVPSTGICLVYYGFAQERGKFVLPRLDKSRVDAYLLLPVSLPFSNQHLIAILFTTCTETSSKPNSSRRRLAITSSDPIKDQRSRVHLEPSTTHLPANSTPRPQTLPFLHSRHPRRQSLNLLLPRNAARPDTPEASSSS
jgi:hypothetical protein